MAQAPEDQRVAEPAPAEERQNERQTYDTKRYTESAPLPVRVIEGNEDAERTKRREQKSDEHEAADLQAQRDAARAAERAAKAGEGQEIASWWTVWIAAIGTVIALFGTLAIIYSLKLTRDALIEAKRSSDAANEANKIAREAHANEFRPRLKITMTPVADSVAYKPNGDMTLKIRVTARNVGASGAFNVAMPWLCGAPHANNMGERISQARAAAEQWLDLGSAPIFPGEDTIRDFSVDILKDYLDSTWLPSTPDNFIRVYFVYTSVWYRDEAEPPQTFESSPCGFLHFTGAMGPFPRNKAEFVDLRAEPAIQAFSPLSKYT
ncbi:MAG: hypothetical protein JNM89_04595 [Hyphomicrobiaceae bacterium]|nr:hypothetical protein [Hyphomicrobiaceae bacterium]